MSNNESKSPLVYHIPKTIQGELAALRGEHTSVPFRSLKDPAEVLADAERQLLRIAGAPEEAHYVALSSTTFTWRLP